MRRPPSLALRLSLLFSIAAVLVFSAFGWLLGRSIEDHFEIEDLRELDVIAQAVQRTLAPQHDAADPAALAGKLDALLEAHHGASLYVLGPDLRVVFASPGPDLSAVVRENNLSAGAHEREDADHAYRYILRRIDTSSGDGAYTVAVALIVDHHLRFLEGFRGGLWLMIAVSIAIMSLMGWIAVRHGLAPLHDIVTTIRRLSTDRLDTRLSPESVPNELVDLARSFNEMLGRVEEAFQRLSNFSADIAHELRTPVASLMTQTQVMLSQARSVEEYRETLYSNMEEYERMAQMIGDMLFLAQAENGLCKPSVVEVRLADEVRTLFDYYEAWAEERAVALTLDGDAHVMGDRLMLRRALSNLLSNAIGHADYGGTVTVSLATNDGEAFITVENPGAELSPEHLPRLFDRFYRVDPSRRRGGVGLGLAIVKSIVQAHGGQIEVISNEGHVRFRITLPTG